MSVLADILKAIEPLGLGDDSIYLRGSCLVVNCDSLLALPFLADASIDCIVCDPPYGHNNNNGDLIHRREAALGRLPSGADTPQARPIANDGEEANEVFREFLPHAKRLLRAGSCCCCCGGGGGPDPQFARWSLWLDQHLEFKQMVVWDKGPMGMGWHYRRSYETVLVGEKPGAACKWFDETDAVENIIRPNGRIRKIIPSKDDHPTPKPVELYEHFILLHTKAGDVVLDPFAGHSPCGIASIRNDRIFVGFEIDPEHFSKGTAKLDEEFARTKLIAPVPPRIHQQGLFTSKEA